MHYKALLPALLGIFVLASAQAQDQRVHPYMEAVSKQFRMDQGYYLEVDYIREDIMRETRVEGEGLIWMMGVKYKMTMDEYIVSYDGKKQYSHNTDMEEVYVSIPDPDQAGYLQAVPMSVINNYQEDFKYQFMGEHLFEGKHCVEIQLYPKDLSGAYSMLKVYVHPKLLTLEGFVLKHKEGIHYTMMIRTQQKYEGLEDDAFRFKPTEWPDTEIIELIE